MLDTEARSTPSLLVIENLAKYFDVSKPLITRLIEHEPRWVLNAVDGVSFVVKRGETFSLVGESGCGKSTVAHLIVGLHEPTRGSIIFEGVNIANNREPRQIASIRRRMQMIFQDPYASLNPRWRVADIIAEPLRAHRLMIEKSEVRRRVDELLRQVGLSESDGNKYPHEFSGGQRQRISIARALSANPDFIVCDEPTSALDVSVQAQILNLMKNLQRRFGLAYLFISHDLSVIYHISDQVGVMYLGKLVEVADKRRLFNYPFHPYTRMLLDAIPDLDMTGRRRVSVAGELPNPIDPPSGCSFHPRCPFANLRCRNEVPILEAIDSGGMVACHAVEERRLPQFDPGYARKVWNP
ncbi:MAG: ATP-binding cassette domain-containing protein [Gammaproteobacteria bacterium]|nr:ATP-binding cassette domain-containing protein [Gammaproteobacteria bacterium]